MSGGSHNYLCFADVPELIMRTNDMADMEQELIKYGYTDIAKDVRRLIEYCLSAENRIRALHDQLSDVFHSIEWYDSGDWNAEELKKELDKYKMGKGKQK